MCCDQPDLRVLDLEKCGAIGVPALGLSKFSRQTSSISEHVHPGVFEFGLCLRGALELKHQGRIFPIMPGQIFINQPDVPHCLVTNPRNMYLYWMRVRLSAPGKNRLLNLPMNETHLLTQALKQLPCVITSDTQPLQRAFVRLFKHYDSAPDSYRAFFIRQACLNLLVELIECKPAKMPPIDSSKIPGIITMMRQNPELTYCIDDLACQAALSSSRFIYYFKQATGLPPMHFLLDCRIEAAKKKLLNTATSITEIAHELGFSSSQHFANQFKQTTGMQPSAFRKNLQNKASLCKVRK
jgi:AraC-like DNA-binding protein